MKEAVAREPETKVSEEKRELWAVCRVRDCGGVAVMNGMCESCYTEDQALEEYYRGHPGDPAYGVRQAEWDERIRRFIQVFLFMLAGEGFFGFLFGFSFTWAWLAIDMGWALLVASIVLFLTWRQR